MAKILQLRRGTTAQNDNFTGAEGELTVDTEKKLLRLHDGSTAGGKEIGVLPTLATVATTGSYSDLSNTPSLATVATTGSYSDLSNTPSLATVATTGSYSDLSNTPSLATVATSGSYTDLSNKPTIPTVPTTVSSFTNDAGYLTAHQDISGKVNTNGSRGSLAGYESTTTGTTVSATSADALVASSAVTVSNGTSGTAWTKIVKLKSVVSVTLGSSWKWANNDAPTLAANGLIILCWCDSSGIAQFVSPTA